MAGKSGHDYFLKVEYLPIKHRLLDTTSITPISPEGFIFPHIITSLL